MFQKKIHRNKTSYSANIYCSVLFLITPLFLSACFDFSGEGSLKQNSGLKGIFAKYADSDSPMVSQSLALGAAMMTDLRAQLQVSGMSGGQVNVVLASVEAELDVMVGSLAIPAGLRLAGESSLTAFDLVGGAIIAGAMKGLAEAIGDAGKDEEKAYYTKVSVGSAFESMQQQASSEDKSVMEKAASLMIASAVQNISSMRMAGSSAGEGIKAITEGAVGSVMLRSGDENSGSQDLAQSIMKATVAEVASVDFEGIDKSEVVKNATLGAVNAVSRSDTKNEKGAQFIGVLAEASISGMSAWKNNSEADTLSSIKAITEGAVSGLEKALGKTADISSALSE
ncbi:MAG: hypothetical protein KBD78_09335, partial [Oligoflexales bacterium]|nr:hypothetical protein [Oligoflexales bacterium]